METDVLICDLQSQSFAAVHIATANFWSFPLILDYKNCRIASFFEKSSHSLSTPLDDHGDLLLIQATLPPRQPVSLLHIHLERGLR